MSEWREDLKKVMISAGLENKQSVFLFSDTQVNNKKFKKKNYFFLIDFLFKLD